MLICLITGGVDFDQLVKVVSTMLSHCKVTIFPIKQFLKTGNIMTHTDFKKWTCVIDFI